MDQPLIVALQEAADRNEGDADPGSASTLAPRPSGHLAASTVNQPVGEQRVSAVQSVRSGLRSVRQVRVKPDPAAVAASQLEVARQQREERAASDEEEAEDAASERDEASAE